VRDESISGERRAAGDRAAEPLVGDEREASCRKVGESRFRPDRQAPHAHELEAQERSHAHGDRARVRSARRASVVVLYAVLAVLVGLLAEWLENPPTVVTVIIVATVFGALVANDVTARQPSCRDHRQ
jgi:hypothetical protein